MSGITDRTIAKLWGMAAGRCSMCGELIVERDVKIGEMAHIIAKKKGGARGELSIEGDINGYENLILLCPNDHSRVDGNPAAYPPEELHRLKDEHESHVRRLFDSNSQRRTMDVAGLKALMRYLPFTQLIYLTSELPERFNQKIFFLTEVFEEFPKDNPQCRPFGDSNLESYYSEFVRCVCELVNYEQHAAIGGKNSYLPGASIRRDPDISYLNPELTRDEKRQVEAEVNELLRNLAASYHPFMDYLKKNYPEVNISSFVGWR